MILKIFIAHNLIAYGLALLVYFNRDLGVDIYQFIERYADNVPALFIQFGLMISFVIIGSWFYSVLFPLRRLRNLSLTADYKFSQGNRRRFGYAATCFAVILNIALMYGVLGQDFFVRETYHDLLGDSAILMLISKVVLFVSIILIHSYSRVHGFFRWTAIAVLVVLSLNYSSLMSAAYPLGLLLYDTLVLRKIEISRIVAYVAATFIVMMCAAYFRGMTDQGIFNYIVNFDPIAFLEIAQFTLYYAWPFSMYVTLATIDHYEPTLANTLIMMNPLPGFLAGWPSISEGMIVQFNVPYSTMGMVFATGTSFLAFFYLSLGFAVGYLDRTIKKLMGIRNYFSIVVIIALGCYIIVLHGGWELRSTMRIVYYCLLFSFLSNLWCGRRRGAAKPVATLGYNYN
jgi:hypothetical protein